MKRQWTNHDVHYLAAMRARNISRRSMAAFFGVSVGSVRGALNRYACAGPNGRPHRAAPAALALEGRL